jgi:hypothetical protein
MRRGPSESRLERFAAANRPAVVLLLLLLACGSGPNANFVVYNTAVILRTDARFAHTDDLPQRFESTVQAALTYWGGTWKDLDGATVTLEGDQHVECNGVATAIGCHDGRNIRISTRDPSIGPWNCIEATVLVHEIGHAVIGDPDHADARWMDFETLADALSGRPGYDGACRVYPSVWRHALHRR